jgi:hypothetical protein
MADKADITANILARYRREADTSSVEAGRNSAAAHQEHTATGVATNGAAVTGAAVSGATANGVAVNGAAPNGAAVSGAAANGAAVNGGAVTGAAVTGIGTPLGAGAFLTRLTTAIILMGITLGIVTD